MSSEISPYSGQLSPTAQPAQATGSLIPDAPMLSKQTYASPMSYVGSLRRTTAWVRKVGTSPAAAVVAWTVGVCWIAMMWVVVSFWYVITFGIFSWLMIPWRLVRRSHRKQEHLQRAQLATMQAMMIQQQQALQQRRDG